MREPNIENKYNLSILKVKELGINRRLVTEPLFWRNNVVNAWCISRGIGKGPSGASESSFWIGVDDNNNKLRFHFSCMEGMCGYNFDDFFIPEDIENLYDLEIQEAFLSTINYLIDLKILYIKE